MKLTGTMGGRMLLCYLLIFSSFSMCNSSLSDTIVVGGGGGGGTPPPATTITITSPTNGPAYTCTSSSGTLGIAGTAFIYDYPVTFTVTWSNDRGGSGTADETYDSNSDWTATVTGLQPGINDITVNMLVDYFGQLFSYAAPLTVTYVQMPDVTAPISGQRLSNSIVTVEGTASDSWQVGSIWYELNNDPWRSAEGTTNWSATVNLTPGTNTVRVYALDTDGVASATNVVPFDFVVTNQLAISTFGLGTLNPNYNNAWLEIGRCYSMTGAPARGFTFSGCLVSTNGVAGSRAKEEPIQFMMESNLTLQVIFAETEKPALVISSPTNNYKAANSLLVLKGSAADFWGVSNVWCQSDGGTWHQAYSTNGWKNWTAALPLASGMNQIQVYAVNLGGNRSAISNVSVFSNNAFKLRFSSLSANSRASNGLNFSLQLSPGLNGSIEVSTNLVNWLLLTNFVGSDSTINFHDPAAGFKQRFYRAIIPTP